MNLLSFSTKVVTAALLAAGALGAQTPQQNCTYKDAYGNTATLPNCGANAEPPTALPPAAQTPATQTPAPGAAKQFPFPGETQEPAASTQSPAAAKPADGSAPAAKQFPFPGEENTPLVAPDGSVLPPAPAGSNPGGLKDAGSSGSSSSDDGSSSSSSSSSSGLSGIPDTSPSVGPLGDDDPDKVIKKPRRKLPPVERQSPSEREQEDLNVAGFYMNDSNYKAAYLRATDAVSLADDDPDAHFALAEAARKLGKLDEALTHYKKCLTLDPVPKEKKAAELAIKQMAGGA